LSFSRKVFDGKDVVFANVLRSSSCGHLFECIEYYYLFKTEYVSELGRPMKPAIFLAYDNFTKEDLRNIIENKYHLTPAEIDNLLEDTYIETIDEFMGYKIHDFRNVTTTVFVEGYDLIQMTHLNMFTLANHLVALRCAQADEEYKELKFTKTDFQIFQDYRVYGERLHELKTQNHVKRLLFHKLKLYKFQEPNAAFMYLSTDCRELPEDYVQKTIEQYPQFSKIFVSVLDREPFKHLETDRVKFLEPPIKSFHSLFGTMIYLPVGRKFDCSSRLIPECSYYGKKVIYHDIDYIDLGLEMRKVDSEPSFIRSNLNLDRQDLLFKTIGRQCIRRLT